MDLIIIIKHNDYAYRFPLVARTIKGSLEPFLLFTSPLTFVGGTLHRFTSVDVSWEVKKIALWSGRCVYCSVVYAGVALRNGAGFSHVAVSSGIPCRLVAAGAPFSAPGSEQITFCVPDFPWASLRHSWVSTHTRAALRRGTPYHFLSLFLSNLGENTNTRIMNYFRTHLLLSILLLASIRTAVGKVCLVFKLRRRTHAVSFVRSQK